MPEGERRPRIGLYGGSFDPIHQGHIAPVLTAVDRLSLDRVIYLPTARPPHKEGRRFAPPLARYCMVELALLEHPRLHVSGHELGRGTAYTVDTVDHFARELPDARLFLLVGADSYLELTQWRRWRELMERVTLVVLRRPGCAIDAAAELDPALAGATVVWVDNELHDLSSTRLREQLRAGEAIDASAVPRLVLEFVEKYSLYR